jgi:hypothetical protein
MYKKTFGKDGGAPKRYGVSRVEQKIGEMRWNGVPTTQRSNKQEEFCTRTRVSSIFGVSVQMDLKTLNCRGPPTSTKYVGEQPKAIEHGSEFCFLDRATGARHNDI